MELEYKVSICVVTYNHEKYLAECLQSLVGQETNFKFEIIVSDDCSSDNTRSIISYFHSKYPNIIRPIFREVNLGGSENYIQTHKLASGKYIAHMDGDDVALPGKLQIQADLLDSRDDIVLVAHPMKIMNSKELIDYKRSYPKVGDVYDLLDNGTYFNNSSTMYRAEYRIKEQLNRPMVDYFRFIDISQYGHIFLLDDVLGEYRIHQYGVSKNDEYAEIIQQCYADAFQRAIDLGVPQEYVHAARLNRQFAHAKSYLLKGNYGLFKKYIAIRSDEKHLNISHKLLDILKRRVFILKLIVFLYKVKCHFFYYTISLPIHRVSFAFNKLFRLN